MATTARGAYARRSTTENTEDTENGDSKELRLFGIDSKKSLMAKIRKVSRGISVSSVSLW
jgi:hypothetical protein